MNMMRLNFLYPLNRRLMAGWVKGRSAVVSFPLFNRKAAASYCTPTQTLTLDRKTREGSKVLRESQGFANNALIFDGGLDEHVAVSPSSFHVILSLLAVGSGAWGRRRFLDFFDVGSVDQINASVSLLNNLILGPEDDGDDSSFGPRIRSSTSLWHHRSLSLDPHFLRSLRYAHRASLFPVDFHNKTPLVRQQINSKVEHDTNGLIKDLISEESLNNLASVKLVFTNILHFKGDWDINNDTQNTNNCLRDDPHWLQDYDYFSPENFVGAEIVAVKRNITVEGGDVPCLILGNEFRVSSKDKSRVNLNCCYPTPPLYTHDKNLDTYNFNTSNYSIPYETFMEVAGRKIPKFKASSEVDALTMLRKQGITLPVYAGGLTEMLCPSYSNLSKELYLFKMLQKTSIDLNEQGSEAATATTAIVVSGCPPHLPPIPCIKNKFYGSGPLDVDDADMMARVGLQVLRHL